MTKQQIQAKREEFTKSLDELVAACSGANRIPTEKARDLVGSALEMAAKYVLKGRIDPRRFATLLAARAF